MDLMTAEDFKNYLDDFETDQKNTIEEDIMDLMDLLTWHIFEF